jgi:hypothetical protein
MEFAPSAAFATEYKVPGNELEAEFVLWYVPEMFPDPRRAVGSASAVKMRPESTPTKSCPPEKAPVVVIARSKVAPVVRPLNFASTNGVFPRRILARSSAVICAV